MTYTELLQQLFYADFRRVERDDRLLDVFPTQTREKGIELWERWDDEEVMILRVLLPFEYKKLKLISAPRAKLEKMLVQNKKGNLAKLKQVATGFEVGELLELID